MKDMSNPTPDVHPVRENFDPGSLVVGNFLTVERAEEIAREAAGEELLSEEDQSLMPSADVDFMTEEQELEMLMQLASWADTFILVSPHRTSIRTVGSVQGSSNPDCAHTFESCRKENDAGEQKGLARAAAQ